MNALFELLGHRLDVSRAILLGSLIAMRVLPITFVTPFLGGRLVPPETRMSLTVGLIFLSYSYATSFLVGPIEINPIVYVSLLLKELFLGFAISFIATLLFYAMEVGGRMLDVARGSNMAEVQVPELQLRASPLGDFKFHLLLVIYLGMNGHIRFIEALMESFRLVPLDGWPTFRGGFLSWVDAFMKYASSLFGIALALVFPGLFASFMTDVLFGMLNRVAPQVNAYVLAMGIKATAGVALFLAAMPIMLELLGKYSSESLSFLERMLGLMGS